MEDSGRDEIRRVAMFDGHNFVSWKFRMMTLLEEHDLVECIEVEIEDVDELKVEDDDSAVVIQQKQKAYAERQKKDKKCKSVIVSRIHDDQLELLHGKSSAKQMWDTLVRIFERKSVAKRMQLNRELFELRHSGGPLQDYFVKYDRLIRLFRNAGGKIDDVDVVCRLLLSLGSEYDAVVTSIESQPEEQITMEFVKCRLLDEEIKRKSMAASDVCGDQNESAAFSSSGKAAARHISKPKQKRVWKCFGCQKEGHKIANCPDKAKSEKKTVKSSSAFSAEPSAEPSDGGGGVVFLADECKSKPPTPSTPPINRVQWFVDSGATEHICNDKSLFSKLSLLEKPMKIAVAKNGEWVTAKYVGDVPVVSVVGEKVIESTVSRVLFIPEARCNLFSISKVESAGMKVVIAGGRLEIFRGSGVVATGERRNKLYELNFFSRRRSSDMLCFSGQISKESELWHRRYGHLGERNLSSLMKNGIVKGIPSKAAGGATIICEPCVSAKQTRNPFTLSEERRSSRVLEIIHSDVCGPVTPVGWNNVRYFVSFVDDWSRFTVVYLIRSKDEVVNCFKHYEAQVTAKFGVKISRFRSDNGGEYTSKAMRSFCASKGIRMEFTVPYTPEQNGICERMNRTLVEKARSMLFDSAVDREFWGEAIQTAAYLTNRSPCSVLDSNLTPSEVWEGTKPDVSKLRVFGSPAYCHIPKERRRKLDEKTWKGVFVGYCANGYRVWNPETRQIVAVRDIIIDENARLSNAKAKKEDVSDVSVWDYAEENSGHEKEDDDAEAQIEECGRLNDSEAFDTCDDSDGEDIAAEPRAEQGDARRQRKPPSWHKDYDMTFAGVALGAMDYVNNLPDTIAELRTRADWPSWKLAVQEELDSLQRNGTWTLCKLPEGRKPITCKWIFRIKPGDDGQPDRFKARLVARGFSQKKGFDFTETYSPVAKLDTLRVMLAIANQERMSVHQMDVRTAFLNGVLSEDIYMTQPEGMHQENGLVCKLNKSIYGLKQASKAWNDKFHDFVTKLGFRRSKSDQCLYRRGTGKKKIFLILYVDDILVIGHDTNEIEAVKRSLATGFDMTDGGEISSFLGMKVERNLQGRTMRISQRRYLEALLDRFNMTDCKASSIPMECRLRLDKGVEENRTKKPYRELVGCLMYVALTSRPDLLAAVNYYSQFQSCPTDIHWTHLKRILRYIKGTLDLGLHYTGRDEADLVTAFCDADWANDISDRRSITGYLFKVFDCTVVWATRKQRTVSLSSTEAELCALCEATCDGTWLVRLLEEVGYRSNTPVPYHEDNQSTIRIIEEPRDRSRLKHIDVKDCFVRNLVQEGSVVLKYIPTERQEADILTKGLAAGQFKRLRAAIGLRDSMN